MAAVPGASSVVIEKSPADHRDYRSVVLPNKLQALLIHDVNTDKAAACLDVKIGSFSEPNEIPGLAHFLEHMLFLCASIEFPSFTSSVCCRVLISSENLRSLLVPTAVLPSIPTKTPIRLISTSMEVAATRTRTRRTPTTTLR